MTFLGFSGLINFITCIILGFFVLVRNPHSTQNRSYFYLNSSVALYSLGYCIWQLCQSAGTAFVWFKVLFTGIILINVTYLHFVFAFVGILKKKRIELFVYYLINSAFLYLSVTSRLYVGLESRFNLGYWPVITPWFTVYLLFWFWQCLYGFLWLIKGLTMHKGLRREQIKYFTVAAIFGFLGGATNWPMWYKVNFPPYFNILISVYIGIVAFAIIKYRLMDIKVVVTRAGIFISVYAVVLGLPFWLGFSTQRWTIAMVMMGCFATAGPFIYNHIRRRAENILLENQKRYHKALRELAKEMTQVKDLDELLKTTVAKVNDIVDPTFIGIYIFASGENAYVLKNIHLDEKYPLSITFNNESAVVKTLYRYKKPVFAEHVEYPSETVFPHDTMIVPQFIEGSLFGFLIVGPKKHHQLYTDDDVAVFDILSNQVSIAIENCLFWQEEKKRLVREEQIRRQRSIDNFSASMAHEIDNPIFAVQCTVERLKRGFMKEVRELVPPEKLTYLEEKIIAISKNLSRISKMIRAVREFSKQTKGEFSTLSMDDVVNTYLNITEPQIKYESIVFEKHVEPNIHVRGNKIHLEEVLINLTTNAIHAVKYSDKQEKKITLDVRRNGSNMVLIMLKDNGYGIKKEMQNDIFLDFVTTKASTEGTGMGLARIRKIVENHEGRVWAESEGEGKGAMFFIELPIVEAPSHGNTEEAKK